MLFTYHLFEEAIGDFPKWVFEHKWLPYHMTHGHWMANNIFNHYPLLLLDVFLYVHYKNMIFCDVAILVWGIINFGDHFFYTIRDRKISPGIITGTLFLVNSIMGLRLYILSDNFSMGYLTTGILIGGVLFGLPIGLCIVTYKFFDRHIK